MRNRVLIQKQDTKSQLWARHAEGAGLQFVPLRGSPILAPLQLLAAITSGSPPVAYCMRYLNDYPGWGRSLARALADVLVVGLCRLVGIRLFWICHNVDRESDQFFPKLSRARRRLIACAADAVLVTDELLVPFAGEALQLHPAKVRAISFGPPTDIAQQSETIDLTDLETTLSRHKTAAAGMRLRYSATLCFGTPAAEKSEHFDELITFINHARDAGEYVVAVVGGDFHHNRRARRLLESLRAHPQVVVFDRHVRLPHGFIRGRFDYFWRGYTDYSVPFSVYEAAALGIPLLALPNGFLGKMVAHYQLGAIVAQDYSNVHEAISAVMNMRRDSLRSFIDERSWDSLGRVIQQLLVK